MKSWRLSDSESLELANLRTELIRFFKHRTSPEDIDNLTTDTIIAAGTCFEHRSSLRHFVFSIARNKLTDWYRRRTRRGGAEVVRLDEDEVALEAFTEPGLGLESLLSIPARHAVLQQALAQVPDDYRVVVELWLAGQDSVQIAATLGINYNTTRSRLVRGKRVLLEAFIAGLDETE